MCSICFLALATHIEAAYLYLDPTSGTIEANKQIEVDIKINTEGEKPTTTDAIIIYDAEKLKVIEVKEPSETEKFFPRFFLNNKTNKIFVGSAIQPQGTPESGEGLIATVIFEAIGSGSTTVSIQCEDGKTTDSNITLKKNQRVTDIIECSKIENANFTLGEGTGPTSTPGLSATPKPSVTSKVTPTSTPSATIKLSPSPSPTIALLLTPTLTATPTALLTPTITLVPGGAEVTTYAIAIGLGLALLSIIIKILI